MITFLKFEANANSLIIAIPSAPELTIDSILFVPIPPITITGFFDTLTNYLKFSIPKVFPLG